MGRLDGIGARVRGLLLKDRLDQELDEELRTHLEMLADEHVRQGFSPEEARRAARLRFGGTEQVKEAVRDSRGLPLVDHLVQDLCYGLRTLRKSPGFTVVAVLTLALGIGATTAVFSLVDSLLLQPLAATEPDRLVALHATYPAGSFNAFPYVQYLEFRDHADVFSGLCAAGEIRGNLVMGHESTIVTVRYASNNYFRVLGVRLALGPGFAAEAQEEEPVAVLSDALWRTRFGADPSVVGKTVRVNGVTLVVTGVVPRTFSGTDLSRPADLYVPLLMARADPVGGGYLNRGRDKAGFFPPAWLSLVGRLKTGVTLEQARAVINTISRRWWQAGGVRLAENSVVTVTPAASAVVPLAAREQVIRLIAILSAAVGLVYLLACGTVAGLLLAREERRAHEMAIRAAIGAGRGRLVRQLLTETLLLAVLGGVLGLAVSRWALDLLSVSTLPAQIDLHTVHLAINMRTLAVAAGASLLTCLVFGSIPALRASRPSLHTALSAGRAARYVEATLARRAAVAFQVAAAVVLLVGTGLLVGTLRAALTFELGFDAEHLLIASVRPELQRYEALHAVSLLNHVADRARSLPGVRAASVALEAFPTGAPFRVQVDGTDVPTRPTFNLVDAGYPDALGVPLIRGRGFTSGDSLGTPPVALVNETMARRLWPGTSAIDRRFSFEYVGRLRRVEVQVVGIVADSHTLDMRRGVDPSFLLPLSQYPDSGPARCLLIRTAGRPASLSAAVRREIGRVDPDLPIGDIGTVEDRIGQDMGAQRLAAKALGAFGLVALFLAALGVYGLVASSLAHRTHEIGVRIALGADNRAIGALVARQVLAPCVIGGVTGVAAAIPASRVLSALLFQIPPNDATTFGLAIAVLTAAASLAAYLPARRATRIDPATALRCE